MNLRKHLREASALAALLLLVSAARAEMPAGEPITPAAAWHLLAGSDSASALRGLWTFTQAPKESVPFIAERMQSLLAGATPQRIAKLIDDLDSPKFGVRERAARELEQIIDTAAPHLQRVLNGKPTLEMTRRVERLLATQTELDVNNPRRLQASRGMALLEAMHSPDARAVLQTISRDGREAWLAQAAEAALERLNRAESAPAEERLWENLSTADVTTSSRAFLTLAGLKDDGRAGSADITEAVKLVAQVPPLGLKSRGRPTSQLPHELLPYRKEVLARYRDDGQENPLRLAVRVAVKALQESETRDLPIHEEFPVLPAAELLQAKQEIMTIQKEKIGEAFFQVGKALEELEGHKPRLAKETKLWQANFTYVQARLYARQACILEYSMALGRIRKDDLPQLDPERHKGWKLMPGGHEFDKDARDLARAAQKLLQELAEHHRQTPWEVIGRHEANATFQLRWVPLKK